MLSELGLADDGCNKGAGTGSGESAVTGFAVDFVGLVLSIRVTAASEALVSCEAANWGGPMTS